MPAVIFTYTCNIYLNPTKRLMVLKLITRSTNGLLSTKCNLDLNKCNLNLDRQVVGSEVHSK
jgi:hypothetical protein